MAERATARPWLFGSLFMGGFECSTHVTLEGVRLDVVAATQHDRLAATDYALCTAAGMRTVRESARWPVIDRGGRLDVDGVSTLARLGSEAGLTLVWDLMHYGYPDDLDPDAPDFGDRFVARFATYAAAVADAVATAAPDSPLWFTPVNEISYNAWSAAQVGYMAPFWHDRGGEYKTILVRAAIAGLDAIWRNHPDARVLSVDPLVRLHVPPGITDPVRRAALQAEADQFNQVQVTEAFDMLAGRTQPELGGSRAHLGVPGYNYYAGNQWTMPTPDHPQHFMGTDEPGWIPLNTLLGELQERYDGPLVIAETGAPGEARAAWLTHLTDEVSAAIDAGVDVQGVCLYPVITSPDWEDPTAFFDGGLFDVVPGADGTLRRVVAPDVAAALAASQAQLDAGNVPAPGNAPAGPPDGEADRPYPPAPRAVPVVALNVVERVRFKPDNFSYETMLSGESMGVEVYGFGPGASLAAHRHLDTEHVLTPIAGRGDVRIGGHWITLQTHESVIVPAGVYHGIHNATTERLVVQQVSAPKPWDARFHGPHPADVGSEPEA